MTSEHAIQSLKSIGITTFDTINKYYRKEKKTTHQTILKLQFSYFCVVNVTINIYQQ